MSKKRKLFGQLLWLSIPLLVLAVVGCSLDNQAADVDYAEEIMRIVLNEKDEFIGLEPVEVNAYATKGWPGGSCTNGTGHNLIIYGPKVPGEIHDNSLYVLPPGGATPWPGWDCDGFYTPTDRFFMNTPEDWPQGPLAVKKWDTDIWSVTIFHTTVLVGGPARAIYRSGDVNWAIPSWSQSYIDSM